MCIADGARGWGREKADEQMEGKHEEAAKEGALCELSMKIRLPRRHGLMGTGTIHRGLKIECVVVTNLNYSPAALQMGS